MSNTIEKTAAPKLRSTIKLTATQPTAQQLADYANALIVVNSYAYAITNQTMPVLNYPPANYGSFTASFAPAKQHAIDWSSDIFVSMVQLPTTIVNQAANLFDMEETMIEAYLNMLISDPTNQKAKQNLATALNTVSNLIQTQIKAVTTIQSQLVTFNTNILADAKTLTQISADATADAGADKQLITTLQANIATLNSQISTAQTLLTVSEIGMGLSIFVGLIGAVCARCRCWPYRCRCCRRGCFYCRYCDRNKSHQGHAGTDPFGPEPDIRPQPGYYPAEWHRFTIQSVV